MSDKEPNFSLERSNLIVGIATLFFTALFSVKACQYAEYANTMAEESLKVAKNDRLQDLQLEKLTQLYQNSQQQLLKQDEMLKDIGDQLAIANRHYALDAKTAKNIQVANFYTLKKALQKIFALMPSRGKSAMMAIDPPNRLIFIDNFQEIILGELNNPYLTARTSVLNRWVDMRDKCFVTKQMLEEAYDGNIWIDDGIMPHFQTPEEGVKLADETFSSFADHFSEFFFFNQENILWKEKVILYGR